MIFRPGTIWTLERRTNRVERPETFMNIPFERTGTLTNMTLNDDIRDMNT